MIIISNELLERIKTHGEKTYKEECCGAIFGINKDEEKIVKNLYEFKNEKDENRRRRYLITSDQYRLAEKIAKESNLELLGFYHSHPDHPAEPSQFDTEYALPWFLYIIVSVKNGRPGDLTGWILKDDRSEFEKQEFSIEIFDE